MNEKDFCPPGTAARLGNQRVFVHKAEPGKRLLSVNWHPTGWWEKIENITPILPLQYFETGEVPDWYYDKDAQSVEEVTAREQEIRDNLRALAFNITSVTFNSSTKQHHINAELEKLYEYVLGLLK